MGEGSKLAASGNETDRGSMNDETSSECRSSASPQKAHQVLLGEGASCRNGKSSLQGGVEERPRPAPLDMLCDVSSGPRFPEMKNVEEKIVTNGMEITGPNNCSVQ